ncbi:M14 family metallopeptidase [Echinicola jeungdonensis]|uniref:M14 metallopeptidase family protein n=1 Tax=Echinicola jeungdonensis TaxID=709343 RepID=A0ABV5J786_9BACT|nr:M14 metallopeptidase family protein [Echinicola jeungdonensis]MDN3669153.1 M14 family metallopeptidase [Echinicola jeungdonensis]
MTGPFMLLKLKVCRFWGIVALIISSLINFACSSPSPSFKGLEPEFLIDAYEKYQEPDITKRRIKPSLVKKLIQKRKEVFKMEELGKSVGNRSIYQLSYGEGPTKVLLWSQMHGDESTATMALFDLFNFLEGSGDEFLVIRKSLKENLQLHFIPMLNPDGAAVFQRRNILGIDLNRDALRLASPEAMILKKARDELEPDFGFNLHDQSNYYNVKGTANPATISVLAPAFNAEKGVNEIRANAMKVIVGIKRLMQETLPDHLGKYDDTFEPRAFGDNFQKWGTSTILIESGAYPNDPEKQHVRQLNFMILLNALYEIAQGTYKNYAVENYFRIPDNEEQLLDLLIKNLTVHREGHGYQVDLGIKREEISFGDDFLFSGTLEDIGDLSVFYGYKEMDASGMKWVSGKIHNKIFNSTREISQVTALELLKDGYLAVRVKNISENQNHSLPLRILKENENFPQFPTKDGPAHFFLEKDGELCFAVVNGFLIDLKQSEVKKIK